jgi:hypothetical protein
VAVFKGMKIPQNLKRKDSERSLLVVTSKQKAKIFSISSERIELIDEFSVEKPVFSDHENQFKMKGRAIGGSASFEYLGQWIVAQFVKKLREHLKRIEDVDGLFLFVPSTLRNIYMEALPVPLQAKVVHISEGNYLKRSPLDLLRKIKDETTHAAVMPRSRESKKIFDMRTNIPASHG